MIAAIGVLAIGWSSLWIVFVWVCCFAFPVLGEFKNRVNDEKWELPKSFGTDPMAEWEYREEEADWRHRDGLTWQMPTVMVSLVGLVMSQIYRESFVPDPEWIRVVILVMFAAMSGGLVVTLKQNLVLQDHSRQIMESISEATARFVLYPSRIQFPIPHDGIGVDTVDRGRGNRDSSVLEALRTDLVDVDPKPFDVCIVGHVTRDVIRSGDARRSGAGGVAYYASLALHRLGRRVAVITKMAKEDRKELLSELEREGITVFSGDSTETTVFDNEYCEGNLDSRVQTVTSVAEPFTSSDLGSVSARWFYLGPLLSCDMSVEFVETVEKRGKVALDAQGLIRKIEGKEIHSVRPAETKELIGPVSLLKVDADEAATLSEANGREDAARRLHAFGPQEVILTFGSKGSMIFENGRFYVIDPIAGKEVDATGCGDTYLAAYLDRRLASNDPGFSGRFAAAAATLALEQEGAFCAGAPEVYTRMRIADTTPRS